MIREIKRYENRKLYEPGEKRYVSLEELAQLVRQGDEIQVVDNATGEDITTQTLTKIISEAGQQGGSLPADLLHDLVRWGGRVITTSREQVEKQLDRLVEASLERLAPVREAREEMARLEQRLAQLESRLAELKGEDHGRTETGTNREETGS